MTDPAVPRRALVLGGASDIAVAIVAELARRGLTSVVLAARDPRAAEAAVRAAAPADLAIDARRWDALEIESHCGFMEAVAADGELDLVVCAVGALGHHAGLSMAPADVDAMVRTNFSGPAAALAAVAPVLERQGHGTVVVLSSVAGLRARRSNYVYGSTKAGLDAFAQGMGDAVAGTGVRVLVVRPGFVVSRMTEGLEPAPMATDPATVADAVADAIGSARESVYVPARLGPLFGALRMAPRRLWRRIAADR